MTINDVDLVTQPNAHLVGFAAQPQDASRRLTFQHFNNRDFATMTLAPHNSDARISDSVDWPPPLIFDIAYGCAVLKTWGLPPFLDFARERTKDIYYDNGDNDDENDDGGGGGGGDGGNGGDGKLRSKHTQQKLDRIAPAARREKMRGDQQASNTADSQAPDFADMLMALWTRKGQRQAHAMKADRTCEKVQSWLDSAE